MRSTTPATLLLAAGLGAITGVRSMAGFVVLTRHAAANGFRRRGVITRWAARTAVARASSILAAGETLFDKLPFTPARTRPLVLIGRVVAGAVVGTMVADARREPRVWPAAVGAGAAAVSAIGATRLRRATTRRTRLPDPAFGAGEDAAIAGLGYLLARMLP